MVAGDKSDPADVLILGAGPAGYVAAIRAALRGRSVTLIERSTVGGVCLSDGCIPSKQLARFAAAKAAAELLGASGMPPLAGDPDLAAFQRGTKAVIDRLVKGVQTLLDGAHATVIKGTARFVGRTRVCVELDKESVRYFDFRDAVVATGSRPISIDSMPFDGVRVFSPEQALRWDRVPSSLRVVGDDYVALELAVAFARLGSRVTLATQSDRILCDFDHDLSNLALRGARAAGIEVQLDADPVGGDAERVIVSIGRTPNLGHLDLQTAGLTLRGDRLKVDPQLRVDRHVFAIGDVTEGAALADRAMMQGRVVGDVLGGWPAAYDVRALPRVVFANPEIATAGVSEEEAQSAGMDVRVDRFPLAALGRGVMESATVGFAKLIFNKQGGHLVGAHLAGPRATELIGEATLAIEMGATAEDLALTAHAHPTFAEALMEAAEVGLGQAIHVYRHK